MHPTRIRRSALPVALVLGLVSLAVVSDTFVVPIDFPTIQEAIDAAMDGDCINVEPGTYIENIDFLGKAITVQSTDGADVTIIDGSACTTGVDACSVVTFGTDEGPGSVLDGFTVTGGAGTQVVYLLGGGICCDTASPTILNCTISGNTAGDGGGMFNGLSSSATLTNCTISGNGATYGGGGGMANFFYSCPTLTNCTISGNTANSIGGGMLNAASSSPTLSNCTISGNTAEGGGGMANIAFSSPTLTNCTISGNAAYAYGGGMFNIGFSSPTLTSCTISGNTANSIGGGMYNTNFSSPTLTSCTISGNTGAFNGGGMQNGLSSSPTLTNCTISGNTANNTGGAIRNHNSSSPILTNCILWGDSPNEIESTPSSVATVTFSDIQGGYPGVGNIDLDPLFVDPDNSDFHLDDASPCIDAGDPTSPPDPDGTISDMGAFFFDQFAGFLRGDLDADGSINGIVDGLFLLGWQFLGGTAPPCMDSADADDSGNVNGLVDGLYVLNFQFVPGSPPPPPPFPLCGSDPTPDGVGCDDTGCP